MYIVIHLKLVHIDVITVGYEDPALEGANITFICRTGTIFTGPITHQHAWEMENGNQTPWR